MPTADDGTFRTRAEEDGCVIESKSGRVDSADYGADKKQTVQSSSTERAATKGRRQNDVAPKRRCCGGGAALLRPAGSRCASRVQPCYQPLQLWDNVPLVDGRS